METVLQQITSHSIAEPIEKVGADTDERQVDPGFVAEQVAEGLERELFGADGFQALFREQAAGQRTQGGQTAQHGAQHGVLVRFATPYQLLQIREREQGHEAHGIGADHAV